MRSGFRNLSAGVLLLAGAAYLALHAAHGWTGPSGSQIPSANHPASQSFDPATGVSWIHDAASQKAYGPLASAMDQSPPAEAETDTAPAARPISGYSAIDHIAGASNDAPGRFLHKRFSLAKYHGFEFVVPVHSIRPELRGKFASHQANIQVLLLNEEEFAVFARGEDGTVTFTTDPSDGGEVDWAINSPMAQPQKYFLIFRSASRHSSGGVVDADFTLSWD